MTRREFFQRRIPRYRKDPLLFFKEVTHFEPDPWQREAAVAVSQHRRVAIRSGQGVGKTALEANLMWWFMQKSGATTKTWHHRPQKNPRDGSNGGPNHVKMDGETVPIDARFSNGLRYPCDPEGPARETIKCRCYVTYNR